MISLQHSIIELNKLSIYETSKFKFMNKDVENNFFLNCSTKILLPTPFSPVRK
jgi:hypothetical protein